MTTHNHMPPARQLQPYRREVTIDRGLRLHCYEAGAPDAPALLLLHGLGDEADTWRHVLPTLAQHYHVIAPDLPGFGRSDRPHRAYTQPFFARCIKDLMTALGIDQATIAGHSMGAAIAQRLALVRPELIKRLILISAALPVAADPQAIDNVPRGRPSSRTLWFLVPGAGEIVYNNLRRSQEAAYETLRPYYANIDALSPEDQTFLRDRVWARVWNAGQRRAFLSSMRWIAIERGIRPPLARERIAALATPTLLIWGDQDQLVPAGVGERLAALLPNARLQIIANCGHMPQLEHPDALIAAIGGGN